LAISQVQGNVSLASMPDSKNLDLPDRQVQGNVSFARIPNPRNFDLAELGLGSQPSPK